MGIGRPSWIVRTFLSPYNFFMMVVVAPLTTQRPWETMTRTPFGAIASSVSSKLVSPTPLPGSARLSPGQSLLVNAPSAVCGKLLLRARRVPQVAAF